MQLVNGLILLPWWGYILVLLGLTHITIICVTVYLHRCQAHRGLDVHPAVAHFFRFWLWMTTGMVTKQWVAVHRKHHAKCETEEDPHSPQILGIRKVLWYGAELYKVTAKNKEDVERYGVGAPDDWVDQKIYQRHSAKGILLMLAINVVLFGLAGVVIWAIQMAWIPFFAAGVINGIGHFWGYRNFECPDAARNIMPWGMLIGGEELHNNHHTFGTSAKFSVKWWEFDLGWFYIRVLSVLGLAKVKRLPPELHRDPSKTQVDAETVKALIVNRFQVMDRYWRTVVTPVFQEEKSKAGKATRKLFRTDDRLLIRPAMLITPQAKQRLSSLLNSNKPLQTVYDYCHKLQAIWNRHQSEQQKDVLTVVQEWCKQAEETGVKVLQDFANDLKSYSVQ